MTESEPIDVPQYSSKNLWPLSGGLEFLSCRSTNGNITLIKVGVSSEVSGYWFLGGVAIEYTQFQVCLGSGLKSDFSVQLVFLYDVCALDLQGTTFQQKIQDRR